MNFFTLLIMASSSSNPKAFKINRNGHVKTTLTRQRTSIVNRQCLQLRENDSDTSESKHSQPTMSTASRPFLVIHSQEERSISSLFPLVIEKVLIGMAGEPKSIKKKA